MDVRRVVTGHDEAGTGVIVSDEQVAPVTLSAAPGNMFHWLWGGDSAPHYPDAGAEPEQGNGYFPPVGGFRFGMVTIPPDTDSVISEDAIGELVDEYRRKLPGMVDYMDLTDPGMHKTPTVDFELVLSGQLVLEVDDGTKVTLNPGDTVVMNGVRHRWSNPGDVPAVYVVAMCGAEHARVNPNVFG